MHEYQVTFMTSDQSGAGTDTAVNFVLIGEHGTAQGILNEGGWLLTDSGLRQGHSKTVTVRSETSLGAIGAALINFDAEPSRIAEFVRGLLNSLPEAVKDYGKGVLRDPATSLGLDDAWNLDYVRVEYDGNRVHMPVHSWLSARDGVKMTVAFGAPLCTPAGTPDFLKEMRAIDLRDPEKNLTWEQRHDGAVPAVSGYPLPLNFAHADIKTRDFYGGLGVSIQSAVTGSLVQLRNRLTTGSASDSIPDFETFETFFNQFEKPPARYKDEWQSDVYWGASFLTGPCAGYFERLDKLPPRLAHLNDAALQGPDCAPHPYMNGSSLEEELAAKRLFIADFSLLAGLELKGEDAERFLDRRYCATEACVILRACTEKDPFEFLPIAIQLEDRADAPLWLPSDEKWDWLTAKAYLMNAASAIHLIHLHWTMCHTAGGIVAAATFKAFSTLHPLRALLLPHVMYTVGLNRAALGLLVNPTGIVEQIFSLGPHMFVLDENAAKVWSERLGVPVEPHGIKYSFEARSWGAWTGYTHLPNEIEMRGLGDKSVLREFPFRDYSMILWDVMSAWVRGYVDLYYKSDDDCTNDPELATFVDFFIEGLGKPASAPIARYREAKSNRDALHELLLTYMFQVSVVHVTRNFTMYDYMAYAPFMSLLLREPFPTQKGQASERRFLDAMPSFFGVGAEVGLNASLNRYSAADWLLGHPLQADWIRDPAALALQETYYAGIREAGEIIERRNQAFESAGAKHLVDPYVHPTRIPSCVAI